jgi:hypothetical protein
LKASEMIQALMEAIAMKGDLDVRFCGHTTGTGSAHLERVTPPRSPDFREELPGIWMSVTINRDDEIVQNIERKMLMQSPPVRWSDGTRVITTRPDPNSDLNDEAKAEQLWGCRGNIVHHSDSHGLCYEVILDRGTAKKRWYLPTELELELL